MAWRKKTVLFNWNKFKGLIMFVYKKHGVKKLFLNNAMSYDQFFNTQGIIATQGEIMIMEMKEKIEEILNGNVVVDLYDENSIEASRKCYEEASEMIVILNSFIKNNFLGDKAPQYGHSYLFLGDVAIMMQVHHWLMGFTEELYSVMVDYIPLLDKNTQMFFTEDSIYIYKYEISRYAKEGNLNKAKKLYEVLINLNQKIFMLPLDLKGNEDFINLWEENE